MTQETAPARKRNLQVIALAVVCVVLAAGLVGAIALQPSKGDDQQATIDALKQQIALFQLNQTDITPYVQQIALLNAQLQNLNYSVTEIVNDLTLYQQIANLQKTGTLYAQQTLTQNPNSYTILWSGNIAYAGYVVIQATSDANSTYAQVLYTFGDFNFNYNQTIGTTGTAVFPVLPTAEGTTLEVRIGNTQTDITNATTTATAILYY